MWAAVVVFSLLLAWFILLRPRKKGSTPLVTDYGGSPYSIPLIGHLVEFFKSPNSMIKRCSVEIGPVFTIPVFSKRLTFLIGPEAQEIFFKASDDVLSQNEVYDFTRPVFGANVVYDAPKRRRQVQIQTASNGLRSSRLKQYVHKIEDETKSYLRQHWTGETGTVDLLTALSELTILTSSRCLHGEDTRGHIFKELQALYHDLDHGLTPLTVFWPDAPTEAHRKRNAARKEMVKLFTKVIQERRSNPSKSDGTDILGLFMEIKYKDGTPITEEEVTGLLIALLFAGQHTSCITSTWTGLFIANDSVVLDKVIAEQQSILGDNMTETKLEFEHVQNMEYLHNCMREALRMCPTFIMILRRAEVDVHINVAGKSYTIPEGDYVCVSPTVSMRQKATFTDPDTFDPDRFAPPREEHKKPYSYLGFGGGLHSCMGQAFAFIQVKTILSVLFREYHIERVAPHMPAVGYEDMVVGPKGDCRVNYSKRK